MDNKEIVDIVVAVQKSEEGAAASLRSKSEKELYDYIFNLVNDSVLAKGLLSETLDEIIDSIDRLENPVDYPKWSKKIAYDNCAKYLKNHKVLDGDIKSNIADSIKGKLTDQLLDEAMDKSGLEQAINDLGNGFSSDPGVGDIGSAVETVAEAESSIVSEALKNGTKTAGKFAAKKIIAGVTAAAVVTGGAVTTAVLVNNDEQPMDWVGYGVVSHLSNRRFELNIDEMDDDSISGHLEVSCLYETTHDTDFTGVGIVRDGDIVYELTFENPAVVGTIPTIEYDKLEMEYDKETDEFSFNKVYEVDMKRVETDLETLNENVKWTGDGEDGFYNTLNKTGHIFEINVDKMTEADISGDFTLEFNGSVDHKSKFTGRGYRKNDVVYYEIKLETPRTENDFFKISVNSFWLHYDTKNETLTIPSSEIYSVVMEKKK